MDDQTDLFAQLTHLHAQGLLSDAEYEEKKAALRAKLRDSATPNSAHDQRQDEAASFMSGDRTVSRRWLVGSALTILAVGGFFLVKAALTQSGSANEAKLGEREVASSGDGPWTIGSTKDPMTDAVVKSARAVFAGQQYKFDVEVTCSSTGELAYTATSYFLDDKPAEMQSSFDNAGRSYIRFQLRADNGQPMTLTTINPRYSNQVVLKSAPSASPTVAPNVGPSLLSAALAETVLIRFFLVSGEETIELPQASAGFRSVVDGCLGDSAASQAGIPGASQADGLTATNSPVNAALVGPAASSSAPANDGKAKTPQSPSAIFRSQTPVSGRCHIVVGGRTIMDGACSGLGQGSSVFVTSKTDGCSVELTRRGTAITGSLFAYRNVCEGIADGQDVKLGQFTANGECLQAGSNSVCLKPD